MKVTEIYSRFDQTQNFGIAFVRSTAEKHHTHYYWNPSNASIDRYVRLTLSNNVIYYSRASRRFITANALSVGTKFKE